MYTLTLKAWRNKINLKEASTSCITRSASTKISTPRCACCFKVISIGSDRSASVRKYMF